jgi:hypothetical protein
LRIYLLQVSFVFGLEVNWSLLQAKVALEADAEEKRKEQLRLDLLELNERRRREKRRQSGNTTDESEDSPDDHNNDDDTNGHSTIVDPTAPTVETLIESTGSEMIRDSVAISTEDEDFTPLPQSKSTPEARGRGRKRARAQATPEIFEEDSSLVIADTPPSSHSKDDQTPTIISTSTDSVVRQFILPLILPPLSLHHPASLVITSSLSFYSFF